MNIKLHLIALSLICLTDMFGQDIANVQNIKINSLELNQEREILVYTPQGYDESSHTSFDVIYVFDSQNRAFFDYAHSTISFFEEFMWKRFIVVGITSPHIEEQEYSRNNDMLPKLTDKDAIKKYGSYSGNANNFLKYIKNEVFPLIEKRYRPMNKRIAVGHSLSASFVIYSLFEEPDLFTDYIAISPNLAFDNNRLANQFINFDFNRLEKKKFLYLSNADEGKYWNSWKPAREKVYQFLKDSLNSDKLQVVKKEYPEEGHLSVFASSYRNGINEYLNYFATNYSSFLSEKTYQIKITVEVPNKKDKVYLTGNQEVLSNWKSPDKIKLNKKSDFQREIILTVQSPIQFKLTRGSWESEAVVLGNEAMRELTLNPSENMEVNYKIVNWDDKIE
jgi:predicted alpha/beta superfamily hydrolase|tara:strand:+ start:66 stop:1241 length:1176 start_codon:yes stop_codon:yes gene_type:complete